MITIRLLGGAKKAVGKSSIELDRPKVSVSEILTFLQAMSAQPRLLEPGNLIVAVNGMDSSAMAGLATTVRDGDTVTVLTVVHGG
jgi:molybdopterin converting factor small subunit